MELADTKTDSSHSTRVRRSTEGVKRGDVGLWRCYQRSYAIRPDGVGYAGNRLGSLDVIGFGSRMRAVGDAIPLRCVLRNQSVPGSRRKRGLRLLRPNTSEPMDNGVLGFLCHSSLDLGRSGQVNWDILEHSQFCNDLSPDRCSYLDFNGRYSGARSNPTIAFRSAFAAISAPRSPRPTYWHFGKQAGGSIGCEFERR